MNVTLPWPPRILSPNGGRAHWAAFARAKAAARRDAYLLAKEAGARLQAHETLRVSLTFRAPTRRRFDLDNALAACKSGLDGIADAIGVDDSRWSITLTRGEPVKGGAVVVEIAPAPEATT